MSVRVQGSFLVLSALCVTSAAAHPQLRPQVTPTNPPPTPKAARIVIQTSPSAQVYLDDVFKGQASEDGHLVIENPTPGGHNLRVSLPGKKDFQQRITVNSGKEVTVVAPFVAAPVPPVQPNPVTAAREPTAGQVRMNPKDGLNYVWIPPGTFMMGCSPGDSECNTDEKPAHRVTITRGFWIGQTPVTVGAYMRFAGAAGHQMPPTPKFNKGWANENMPIVNVTWDDAQAYCGWEGGRLPTEAEWEYAARAGSTEARYGNLDEIAWYDRNSEIQTHDVARKRSNGFGLYDMLGNVWEWVNDWYEGNYYQSSPSQDPQGPAAGQQRILRGGSWFTPPSGVRLSDRYGLNPAYGGKYLGLRCGGDVVSP